MKVRWEEMFPDELDAALAQRPIVYLTYGLCEPHGMHNALGLDALKAHALACQAAEAHGGIVAPPSFWHMHELTFYAPWADRNIGDRNPWLTALPPWVFLKNLLYHLRAVDARGFQAAIVITGHAGSPNDFKRICEIYSQHSPMRTWACLDAETIDYENVHGDHAGRCETSQLWSLRPELVDMSRLIPRSSGEIVMATGHDAQESSRRLGDGIVASQVKFFGEKVVELLAAYQPPAQPASRVPGNPRGALTFGETERIWRNEIEPVLHTFESFQFTERTDPRSPWSDNQMSHVD